VVWQRRIVEALEALDRREREVVVAAFYAGLGPRQVAARVGLPPREASALLARALDRMREHLDRRVGARSAWAVAIAPLFDPRPAMGSAATAAAVTGGTVMGTKALVAAGVAVAAAAFVAGRATAPAPPPESDRRVAASTPPPAPEREASLAGSAPTQGRTAPAPEDATAQDRSPEAYLRRILAAGSPKDVGAIAVEIRALPAADAWTVVRTIYGRIEPVEKRRAVWSAFAGTGHPHEVAILGLGASEARPEDGADARRALEAYAMLDLEDDVHTYRQWAAEWGGATPADALRGGVRRWVDRMRAAPHDPRPDGGEADDAERADRRGAEDGDALREELRRARRLPPKGVPEAEVAAALRDAGFGALLDRWRGQAIEGSVALPDDAQTASVSLLPLLDLDDASYRAAVEPILSDPGRYPQALRNGAFGVVGERRWDGAVDLLLRAFETTPNKYDWWNIAMALEKIRDPRSIPVMVGMIVADDGYESVYGIGYFGLSKWLGVKYLKSHDAAWWREWWAANQERLPPEVRGVPIPHLSPVAKNR
jgi:hypothetical protein